MTTDEILHRLPNSLNAYRDSVNKIPRMLYLHFYRGDDLGFIFEYSEPGSAIQTIFRGEGSTPLEALKGLEKILYQHGWVGEYKRAFYIDNKLLPIEKK